MSDDLRALANRTREIVGRIRRLGPPHSNNPHKWHEDKSEIARDTENVAADIERLIAVPSRTGTNGGRR